MPFISINPATEEINATYDSHSDAQVQSAIAEAHDAFSSWKELSFADRAVYMVRAAELIESEIPVIAELMSSEMGKTFAAAKGEAAKCASTMRYYAEHAEELLATESIKTPAKNSGVRYDPVGALFGIMPWNFPLWQITRFVAPNMMAGNVVLIKHAPNVPGCAKFMADLFTRAGFPTGVYTNLFVEVEQVESIISDARIQGVTLTGSERAGRSVAALAGKYLKKCVLELGGSDPFIVASSADMDHTIPLAVTARVQNNGQACIAAKRFIVVKDRAEEFISKFSEAMSQVPVGSPMEPTTVIGPLVNKSQYELITSQVSDSVAKGAVVHTGGAPLDGKGYFYPATVLSNVSKDSRAGCEELFGPVAVVYVVEDLTEAIDLANDTPWGLGAMIYATDVKEIHQAIEGIDAGMVFANSNVASMPELPFGGTKSSGFGRELGAIGIREFMNAKTFYVA
jgi:succinate-semialdehyde dehydrogenase/glutarate-semialdehyde dehydrogenase